MAQTATDRRHFTYADYCTWPQDERWELIDGAAYAMSPAPTRLHQEVVVELARQIGNFLQDRSCRVYVAPFDVRLPAHDEADAHIDSVVQPDLAVICDPAKLDERGCRGAPDWIVEVLSPHTAAKDMIVKRELYQRHGVREYWLVHPSDRLLWIHRLAAGRFGNPELLVAAGATPVGILPDLAIDWQPLFPAEPPASPESPSRDR